MCKISAVTAHSIDIAALLAWYHAHRRAMPWRAAPSPYRVWISEIMLQQTQVDTVIPYFERFLALFPDVATLAQAKEQAVLKAWEGLGYYSRARNLQRAAQTLLTQHQGRLPETFDALRQLAGIGDYTAAAIASIAFGERVPVVDGNVLRVCARQWGLDDDIRKGATRKLIFQRLSTVIAACTAPGDFNQAMMELGALVCTPRQPQCDACPLAAGCVARRDQRVHELPVVAKRQPVPHYAIAVAVIWKHGKLLIARRQAEQMLGGLWEFPGGKQEAGESLAATAEREVREETGLTIRVGSELVTVQHAYSHFRITLTAFTCTWISGRARPHAAAELKWVTPAQLQQHPFPTANRRVIEAIEIRGSSVRGGAGKRGRLLD